MAVGLVTGDNEIVYVEEIHTFEEQVQIRIEEDYDKFVKGNETDFKDAIEKQIEDLLNVGPLNVRDLTVTRGSIIVDFLLVGSNEMEADQLKQSYAGLIELLEKGELKLVSQIDWIMKCIFAGSSCAVYREKCNKYLFGTQLPCIAKLE